MSHTIKLTEQMAACDALLRQRGLHCGNGGGEDVGLLQHLRGMWSIQRAKHSAVVELHALIQLDYRELVPAGLGAPVFVLQSQTQTHTHKGQLSTTNASSLQASRMKTACNGYAANPAALTTTQFSEWTTWTGPLAFR